MTLTPLDIQHKEFTVKMKGYDKEQVNDFLDTITKSYEEVLRENKDLQKQLKFSEEKNQHFINLQDALNKSIVVAQDAADRLKENARKEAEIILFEAEKSADRLLHEAAGKATKINEETDIVRKESRNFKQKLQLLVESQLNLITNDEWNNLLNALPEGEVETPTLNEVLSNRTRVIDELIADSEDAAEFAMSDRRTPAADQEEDLSEGSIEAIEIPEQNK
ncbi:diviva protein [Trichococcus palustris]|uniref:Diviva protein n=1 Tax=Trichococcus palustris TaxID=140314 RepID=A0A143YNW9_9LACT|nr:DivIVA domain-containing protein [Trichococcus palustris]CZQ94804.1 diviva protein [Trichococcus palustris]SFK92062.1 cell division initiation protein [Trichococcus palustris]